MRHQCSGGDPAAVLGHRKAHGEAQQWVGSNERSESRRAHAHTYSPPTTQTIRHTNRERNTHTPPTVDSAGWHSSATPEQVLCCCSVGRSSSNCHNYSFPWGSKRQASWDACSPFDAVGCLCDWACGVHSVPREAAASGKTLASVMVQLWCPVLATGVPHCHKSAGASGGPTNKHCADTLVLKATAICTLRKKTTADRV